MANNKHGNYKSPGLGVTKQKSMLNSMLVNKDFLTWLLIGWRLCCQPIRCQVWKSLLTNMDFNMEFFSNPGSSSLNWNIYSRYQLFALIPNRFKRSKIVSRDKCYTWFLLPFSQALWQEVGPETGLRQAHYLDSSWCMTKFFLHADVTKWKHIFIISLLNDFRGK